MTDEEIRAYIKFMVAEEKKKQTPANRVFSPVVNKWFMYEDERGSKMGKALGGYSREGNLWEHIRPIATRLCRADHVMAIKDPERACRYAEAICQFIYDLATEEQ